MNMNTVLDAAITLLKNDGWCQEEYERSDGAHCLVGALEEVSGRCQGVFETEVGRQAYFQAKGKILYVVKYGSGLEDWNDTEGRTVEEVLAALEKAKT